MTLDHNDLWADRRKQARIANKDAVFIRLGDRIIRGTEIRNISIEGMLITVGEQVDLESRGTVAMTYRCGNETNDFKADFRVAHCTQLTKTEIGMGVEFLSMDDSSRQGLTRIISYLRNQNDEEVPLGI